MDDASTETPLSLYHLLDPEVLANPYPLYERLRSRDPVYWDPYLHAWIVTRYEDVITVLTKFSAERAPTPEFFAALGAPEVSPIAKVMVKQMLFLDGAAHARLRKLAGGAFVPARVRVLNDKIQAVATKLIDDIIARGTGRLDLLADFAEPLPGIVTADMLGVPIADHVHLKKWSETFAEMLGNFQHNPDRLPGVQAALDHLVAYFEERIREQRVRPTEGLVNTLLTSVVDGDRLTDEEVIANCVVTMVGGLETTTNLIGNGMLTLLRHPAQLQRLRDQPGIMPAAIEELLRYESPSQHTGRLAPDDVVLGGKLIKKRQAIIAVMAAGNRDPERFPDPDRLDFDRPDNRHLAFGWAAHFCFGAPLARAEALVSFGKLLDRFPVLQLTNEPLVWRDNLGLRGLKALPLLYLYEAMSAGRSFPPDPALHPPRLRVATFDDYDGVVALESAAGMVSLDRDDWRNLWLNNPVWPRVAGSWPIGWVLEASDGRVVGSVFNIPALYLFQGRELVSANGRGWVVDPPYRGYAVSLMAEYFSRADVDLFVNTTAGSNAVSTNLMFSQRIPAGDFNQAAYVEASYRRRAVEALRRNHVPLAHLLARPAATRLYQQDVRRLHRLFPRTRGLQVDLIGEFDERFDAFWTALVRRRPDVLLAVRDRATLAWHFTVPLRRGDVRILTASSQGLRGYCILRRERMVSGRSCLRLVDFQTLDAPAEVLPEFLRAALRLCRDEDIDVLEHFGCGLPKLAVFDTFAPHRRPWDCWPCYFRAVDDALRSQLADPRHWDPSAYDGDFTYD